MNDDTERLVHLSVDQEVAVIRLRHPPVNLGNAQMRRDLLDAIDAADRSDVRAIVLASSLADFYSGSDLKEFDGPIATPQLPDVIARLDRLQIPVIAAVQGNTLGGGLELALAADRRIASPRLTTGFPECALGVIPGAGGTVRAARLIGPAETMKLVATAARLDAQAAMRLGVIDEIVAEDQLVRHAVESAPSTGKKRLIDLPPPQVDPAELDVVDRALRKRGVRPNVLRALELIYTSSTLSASQALSRERALFTELRTSEEARSLRYLFFARRTAARASMFDGSGRQIDSIGVAGAGTMGTAIAQIARDAGLRVVLFDTDAAALARARAALGDAPGKVCCTDDMGGVADVDVVLDAVYEHMDVKRSLFAALNTVLRNETIVASNTSYLDLDQLGETLVDPSRFAGLHFFNPAARNPLVEIVRTRVSSPTTLATLGRLSRRLAKVAVPVRVGEGFVANRVYADYRAQAEFLLEEGATPGQVDAAMTTFGLRIGPFRVGDMSGLDIAWARRQRLAGSRPAEQRYVAIPDRLCELGRLGVKSGAGYFDYPDGPRSATPSAVVQDIIEAERQRKGIRARNIPAAEIADRCVAAMVVGAAAVMDAQVAERASDIDLAMVEGFAFPRWLGGPVRHVTTWSHPRLAKALRAVYESDPIGFASAAQGSVDTSPLRRVVDAVSETVPAGTSANGR